MQVTPHVNMVMGYYYSYSQDAGPLAVGVLQFRDDARL